MQLVTYRLVPEKGRNWSYHGDYREMALSGLWSLDNAVDFHGSGRQLETD